MSQPRILIVGIGSSHGDDQAGWLAVRQVANELDSGCVAVRQAASPDQLLAWIDGVEAMIVCDACRGSGEIGEVKRWTWPLPARARAAWTSTHGLTLPAVLQLAEQLGQLPPRVVIWTVEAAAGGAMHTLSPQVETALPRLCGAILHEIEIYFARPEPSCTNSRS